MKKLCIIGISAILSSCVNEQHLARMTEIENARAAGKITNAEYLQLKNQADLTYATKGQGLAHRLATQQAVEKMKNEKR